MECFDDFLSNDDVESQEDTILTTKKALELLLDGKLDEKVCKFCLKLSLTLHDLDEVFSIGGQKLTYNVSINDMLGTIYPFQVSVFYLYVKRCGCQRVFCKIPPKALFQPTPELLLP